MKHLLFLLLLPVLSIAEEKKEPGLSAENIHDLGLMFSPTAITKQQQTAMKLSREWRAGLNKFLAETNDPYLLAKALMDIVSSENMRQGLKKVSDQKAIKSQLPAVQIAKSINAIVKSATQLLPETMALFDSICFYKEMIEYCEKPLLIEKRILHDPKNLNSYFKPLILSAKEKDDKKLAQVFSLMTQTVFSDNYNYNLPSFKENIEKYNTANPMPQEVVDNELAVYLKMKSPNEADKASRQKHMRTELLYLIEVTARMASEIPDFRFLIQTCEDNPQHHNDCLKIANILTQNSRDYVNTLSGYKLKEAVYNKQNKSSDAQNALTEYESLKAKSQCLFDYINKHQFHDVLKSIEQDRIGYDPRRTEFDNLVEQAEFLYAQHKGESDIKDPTYCIAT